MKTIITIIIVLLSVAGLVFLSSCGCNERRGNGHVIKQERKISPFNKISIEGVFPVVISQDGGEEWVKVESDKNLQDLITVENDGDELIISVAGLVFLSSCGCNERRGNGHVIKQERKISPFNKISIEGVFPVVISQDGGEEWVKVESDKNLQDLITVENDGDELIISSDDNVAIRRSKKLKIYINVKNLREIKNQSVGSIVSSGALKIDSLEINSESVGKLELGLQAKFLRANLNSIGVTTLSGEVDEVRINNKSVGALHAYNLKAQTLMIHNTAIGLVEVSADKEFRIRSSGIGNLYYKGDGQLKEVKHEGIGKVERAE